MTNDAPDRVLAALEEVARYPEYAHKVNWAVNDFIRRELMAYGRAWEQTAGPVSDRGGSPMEVVEEIVGAALQPLLAKIVEVLLSVQDHAQSEKEAAVAAEREACAEAVWQECYPSTNQGYLTARQLTEADTTEDAVSAIRARSDSDALKAYRRQIQAEALREAAELAFNMTENDNLSRAVLALIPDTDEVDECP